MPLHEPSEDSVCHNCNKVGKTKRCSKCKRVRYCSRECQQSHWKAGHKKTCGISVQDALLQLHKLGLDMSLPESIEEYHKATDAVDVQLKMQSNTSSSSTTMTKPRTTNKALDESPSKVVVKKDASEPQIVTKGEWDFIIEHLSNISTYMVMLVKPSRNGTIQLDDIKINLIPLKQNTKVTVYSGTNHCLAEFMIPKQLYATATATATTATTDEMYQTLQSHHDQNISFRIRYVDSLYVPNDDLCMDAPYKSTPNTAINMLQCKSCEINLVRSSEKEEDPSPIIQHVYPLPSGHWDEITDYLTCFEGQATVDFSSVNTTATKGVAFEDEVTLVMNMEDLTNVCVLAVDGLGQQVSSVSDQDVEQDCDSNPVKDLAKDHISYRGQREWKDSVEGATLCCSICCSNIGNVSLTKGHTCRLYKHRLSSRSLDGKDYFMNSTCGTFVAKELVRYLENQAIFTFAIYGRIDGNSNDTYDCIVLKVLSWNSMIAMKEVGEVLRFEKIVKVLYEVIDLDKMPKHQNTVSELDPMSFTWGGVDLCCPPNQRQTEHNSSWQGNEQISSSSLAEGNVHTERASVNMYLYGDDWMELKNCLENGSRFFPKEMSMATVALKFGPKEGSNSNATMSFLQL